MLLAALAFVLQGTSVIVAQAAAASGFMPHTAQSANGPVHFHGQIGHVVDTHGQNAAGHVHLPSDLGPHGPADAGLMWSVSCSAAIEAAAPVFAVSFESAGRLERLASQVMRGVDPQALTRPPSTPSIA